MNYRDWHRKPIIGMLLLFIAGIIFTGTVEGQEPSPSTTPLSLISSYNLPKEPEPELSNLEALPSSQSAGADGNTVQNEIPPPFPETDVTLEKVCEPAYLALGEEMFCTVTIQNNSTDDIHYKLLDWSSYRLVVEEDSVIGGDFHQHNIITQHGFLAAGTLPSLSIEAIDSPIIYDSLRELGIAPLIDVPDEAMINVATLEPYLYGGEEYTTIGIASNGYLIPGLGSDEDIDYVPQVFPDPAIPNNVIAPFWTDLNPEAGGDIYAALYIRGEESWVVVEWEDVPLFEPAKPLADCIEDCTELYTFQAWIKTNTTEQDITFVYARVDGSGSSSGLNIGVENAEATVGANYETVPTVDDKLGVITTLGTEGESHILSYTATADRVGHWYGYSLMKVFGARGIISDCVYGNITE